MIEEEEIMIRLYVYYYESVMLWKTCRRACTLAVVERTPLACKKMNREKTGWYERMRSAY